MRVCTPVKLLDGYPRSSIPPRLVAPSSLHPLPCPQVGAAKLRSDLTLNWGGIEGFRIAGKQGIGIIAACQAVGLQGAGALICGAPPVASCSAASTGWGMAGFPPFQPVR